MDASLSKADLAALLSFCLTDMGALLPSSSQGPFCDVGGAEPKGVGTTVRSALPSQLGLTFGGFMH